MKKTTGLRGRIAAVAAATAVLTGAGLATATTASAGYACPAGYHCAMNTYPGSGAAHNYFNSDPDFTDDVFDQHGTLDRWGYGYGQNVNDNVSAASNSSTGGYESHYYRDINYGGGLLFCLNPGSDVNYMQIGADLNNEASSLKLRPTTSVHCF